MVRWRTTGVLLIVFLALAAVTFWVSRRETSATPTRTPPPRVIPVDVEDVQRVDILQGDRQIAVQRSGDRWLVVGEVMRDADSDDVDRRLRSLLTVVAFDHFVPEALDEFGLAQPQARVVIQAYTGTVTLLIGDATPTGNDYYVQREGDPTVYVVSKYLVDRVLEWVETPPYKPTPTPTATSTPS